MCKFVWFLFLKCNESSIFNLLRFASNFLGNENIATKIKFKGTPRVQGKESLNSCKVTPYPSLTWEVFLSCNRLNCFTALVQCNI